MGLVEPDQALSETKRRQLAREKALAGFDRPVVFALVLRTVLHEAFGDRQCLLYALT